MPSVAGRYDSAYRVDWSVKTKSLSVFTPLPLRSGKLTPERFLEPVPEGIMYNNFFSALSMPDQKGPTGRGPRVMDTRHLDPTKTTAFSKAGEDRNLVLAVQRGDSGAAHELYRRYRKQVYNLVVYSIGDSLHAQDLLQTVFLKVFRGLPTFRFRSSLATWIYRITHNECQDHHRRRAPMWVPLEAILGSPDEIDTQPLSDQKHALRERGAIVRQAVMQLSFKMREVVVLRYVEGLSYEEIGRVLRCAPGTVASRLSRALIELEERLRPFGSLL
jgi:RNA polymerase sigma factor (sigma-70 family)